MEKNRTGQCPSVTVVVENNNNSQPPLPPDQKPPQPPVISSQYAPVTSHLASSLTMSDFIKLKSDVNLNDSLGPLYYPQAPISTIPEPPGSEEMLPSPMAPLVPPWPHLPPITTSANEKTGEAGAARSARSLNSSFNNRVNYLSNQILNPQNHTQSGDRRVIR